MTARNRRRHGYGTSSSVLPVVQGVPLNEVVTPVKLSTQIPLVVATTVELSVQQHATARMVKNHSSANMYTQSEIVVAVSVPTVHLATTTIPEGVEQPSRQDNDSSEEQAPSMGRPRSRWKRWLLK